MPRVLQILNRSIIGGPVVIASLLTKFMPEDFETILLSGYPAESEQNATELLSKFQIKPVYMPEMGRALNPLKDWITYRKIKKIIKEYKPDIVHTHAAKPGVVGRLAAYSLGVPVIIHTYHGHVFHSYFSKISTNFFIHVERYLSKKSTRLIAISPLQKTELVEDFQIAPAEKFEVVPIGLYLEPFQTDQEKKRQKFRNEFKLDDETIAISIVGRLSPIKNHGLFVRAIVYLQGHTNKKFKAFIVGGGECRNEIETLCSSLKIEFSTPEKPNQNATIIFTSWRTDVDVVTSGSDIIALSSLNEGTPVSLIEAQASGKPIVATLCGGMADSVMENKTALLSDPKDESKFFDNLLTLVNNDALRSAFGKNGPAWANERYGHLQLIQNTAALYRNLLHQKTALNSNPKLMKLS